jgi:hypothetical protein
MQKKRRFEWLSNFEFNMSEGVFYFGRLQLHTPAIAPASVGVLSMGSAILDVVGIDAAIWHISWIAGLLLIISGVAGVIVFSGNADRVRSQRKNPLSRLE